MSSKSASTGIIIAGVVANVLSVVGIVICNKYITEIDGYNFMVFLSFLHFSFTMVGTRVMLMIGMFQYKAAPMNGILPVAIGSLLSVAFMNLNLSNNSVGFYQLSKLACIPFTLLVQYVAYSQSVPKSVQLTLIPISFGVGYATVYDLNLNYVGTGKSLITLKFLLNHSHIALQLLTMPSFTSVSQYPLSSIISFILLPVTLYAIIFFSKGSFTLHTRLVNKLVIKCYDLL